VSVGAAALAFYLMLSVFPAAISVLTLLPFLPIPHLEQALTDLLRQLLPGNAAGLFTDTVHSIVAHRHGGLLSFGLLLTVWSASNGLYAVMQQLNATYEVDETRPVWTTRALALALMLLFLLLIVGASALVVFGGVLQAWLGGHLGWSPVLLGVFAVFRWAVIGLSLLVGLGLVYYLGPNADQPFRWVTPGGSFAAVGLLLASLGFRLYAANIGRYDRTYGSLGEAIVLLVWLFITGWVILLGSEINALLERRSAQGATERKQPKAPHAGSLLHQQPG
jgi:membrane protein